MEPNDQYFLVSLPLVHKWPSTIPRTAARTPKKIAFNSMSVSYEDLQADSYLEFVGLIFRINFFLS